MLEVQIREAFDTLAFLFAIAFPIIRAFCRKRLGIKPLFISRNVFYDMSSGALLSYFILIAINPILGLLGAKVEISAQVIWFAGLYGIYMIVDDLINYDARDPSMRTRSTDN